VGGAPVILVVGDVMDDVVVRPLGDFKPGADTPARIEPHPGGQGANTAAWLGALGAPVRFAGRVGAGDVDRHVAALAAHRVDARLAADPDAPTGRLVVITKDRSMFTDRGANARLAAADLPDALFEGVAHVHVSGYALVEEGPREAVLGLVRRAGVPWSVDPGSAPFVGDTPFLEWTAGAAICFPNADEADAMGEGLPGAYEVVILKRGSEGVRVLRRGSVVADVPALAVEEVDPTGAGDALAAGFLATRLRGADDEACARAAVSAAANAISRPGARPG
jgi:sugar/nucleoside kinase (ribokinase family)